MRSLLLILTTLLIAACSSKGNLKDKQASLYFGAGTQSLIQGDYTEALANLLKANELNPNNSDIINNLGMAYYFKGEKSEAHKHLNRALELNPNNTDAKINLASIHYQDGEIDQAEALYKVALKDLTYDKQARTYFNLGLISQINRRDNISAIKYYEKSIKEDPNYCPSFFQMGIIQFKNRKFNSALKNFKESSMGTCYNTPSGHYHQALTLIELKRYNEARLKLESIESRFKNTKFGVNARAKLLELNENVNQQHQNHASGRVIESPDF